LLAAIERPADSSNTVGGGINSLASSQGAASGTAGLANGHVARNDTPGRDVLLEQVQLQQRRQLQPMAAGGRSGAERSQGNSHFYAVPLVGGDRPALQPARFGSAAVSVRPKTMTVAQASGAKRLPASSEAAACFFDYSGRMRHISTNDSGKVTALVLLNLSAAFDTNDHEILLNRLATDVGVTSICVGLSLTSQSGLRLSPSQIICPLLYR